jgi:hypothetical protein
MELVRRIMAQQQSAMLAEQAETAPPIYMQMETDEGAIWLTPPPWAHRWKRMVMMTMIVSYHALTGSFISYFEMMRERAAQKAKEEYQRLAGATAAVAARTQTPKKDPKTPKPMAKGKALSRSTASEFTQEPQDCLHPAYEMSQPRGGRGGSAWVTCLRCGSRWERVWETESQPAPSTPPVPTRAPKLSTPATTVPATPPPPIPATSISASAAAAETPSPSSTVETDFEIIRNPLTEAFQNLVNQGATRQQAINNMFQMCMNEEETQQMALFAAQVYTLQS